MKKFLLWIVLPVAVFLSLGFFVAWCRSDSSDDTSKSVASKGSSKSTAASDPTDDRDDAKDCRILKGKTADIVEAIEAATEAHEAGVDAKIHVVVHVSAEKKPHTTPSSGESWRSRSARQNAESLDYDAHNAKQNARNAGASFGEDSGTTNTARIIASRVKKSADDAWEEYEGILQEEGCTSTEAHQKAVEARKAAYATRR